MANPGYVFRPQNPGFRAKILNGLHGSVPFIKVQTNQNIFDLALQGYGDVECIYYLIVNNQLESAATLPVPGTNLIYNASGLGNEALKKQINTLDLSFGNGQSAGSFNENFNPDFD